jgi:hypothetical protein
MRKRNLPENESNNRVIREKDPIPWRYCLLTLIFGILLVGGFFLAARQHFSAIDYGIKNAELRKKRDNLESEKRQTTLSKEKASSYDELEKTAQRIGLVKLGSQAVEVASDAKESVTKTFLPKNRETKKESLESKETKDKKDFDDSEKYSDKDHKNKNLKDSDKTKSDDDKDIKKETLNKSFNKTGAK